MSSLSDVVRLSGNLSRSPAGRLLLCLLILLAFWVVFEWVALSGTRVYSDYLAYNTPLTLVAGEEGERFRVSISSSNKKVKRRIRYKVVDPEGAVLVDSQDGYQKATRAFYFTARRRGNHVLIIDEHYRPGGITTPGPAAAYLNSKWVRVYRSDQTRLLGLLGNFISW